MELEKFELKEPYNGCTHAIAVSIPLSGAEYGSIEYILLDANGNTVGGLAIATYDTDLITDATTMAEIKTIINEAIQTTVQAQIDASNVVLEEPNE